ncbi:hypothetical protein [Deinococcus yavapaiensis]|uniref:hypothetical protein n=1 Tax=Deinococcus yavapaiensis TaxID=309889 RepID=UPI000DA18D94|nr:hypothetical protein [Deinococcus yavapaiensis]
MLEDAAPYPTFRLDLTQTAVQLEGDLELRADFPQGSGYEFVGPLRGDVQGDIVKFEVQGVNDYAGKMVSFLGHLREGRLEGDLVSQVGERLKSGRVVIVRR